MFEKLKSVFKFVPAIPLLTKSAERLAYKNMIRTGDPTEFIRMLDNDEIRMIRKDTWTWVSANGVIHVYNDIYGPEVKLGGISALIDCNGEAYGLSYEDGKRVYNAIWDSCDRSRRMAHV